MIGISGLSLPVALIEACCTGLAFINLVRAGGPHPIYSFPLTASTDERIPLLQNTATHRDGGAPSVRRLSLQKWVQKPFEK